MKVSSAQSVTSAVNSSDLVVLCEFATASLQKDLKGSGTTRPTMLWPQNGGIPYSKHVKSVSWILMVILCTFEHNSTG